MQRMPRGMISVSLAILNWNQVHVSVSNNKRAFRENSGLFLIVSSAFPEHYFRLKRLQNLVFQKDP